MFTINLCTLSIASIVLGILLVACLTLLKIIAKHVAYTAKDLLSLHRERQALIKTHGEYMKRIHEEEHNTFDCKNCLAVKGGMYNPSLQN